MNKTTMDSSASELFKADCKRLKIKQKDLSRIFGLKELTVNRMLNGMSHKLDDAFHLVSCVTKCTGKMAFQYTGMRLEDNPRLKLIDDITRISDDKLTALIEYKDQLEADNSYNNPQLLRESMPTLYKTYFKILLANLTTDTCTILRQADSEWNFTPNNEHILSEWFKKFGESRLIHPDYRSTFLEATTLTGLKKYMNNSNIPFSLTYPRRVANKYRWVNMSIFPASEYSRSNQLVLICVHEAPEDVSDLLGDIAD